MADDDLAADLVLGSASPRRADLLRALGVNFHVETVDLDEQSLVSIGADIVESVSRIAHAKFAAFGPGVGAPQQLMTADTLVGCNGEVMGKPSSDAHLSQMLTHMSGQSLTIVTAVCVGTRGQPVAAPATVTTDVRLRSLDADEIDRYVRTGAGRDKAAGLSLQSEANAFIDTVDGCWSNVMGLPVCLVAAVCDLAPAGRSQIDRCVGGLCRR